MLLEAIDIETGAKICKSRNVDKEDGGVQAPRFRRGSYANADVSSDANGQWPERNTHLTEVLLLDAVKAARAAHAAGRSRAKPRAPPAHGTTSLLGQ